MNQKTALWLIEPVLLVFSLSSILEFSYFDLYLFISIKVILLLYCSQIVTLFLLQITPYFPHIISHNHYPHSTTLLLSFHYKHHRHLFFSLCHIHATLTTSFVSATTFYDNTITPRRLPAFQARRQSWPDNGSRQCGTVMLGDELPSHTAPLPLYYHRCFREPSTTNITHITQHTTIQQTISCMLIFKVINPINTSHSLA